MNNNIFLENLLKLQKLSDKGKFEEIAEDLDISVEGVEYIANFMKKNLNTNPGLLYKSNEVVQSIIPSFIIEKDESNEEADVEEGKEVEQKFTARNLEEEKGPQLRLNKKYLDMLDDSKTDEKTREYLKEKIEAAREFIEKQKSQEILDAINKAYSENETEQEVTLRQKSKKRYAKLLKEEKW